MRTPVFAGLLATMLLPGCTGVIQSAGNSNASPDASVSTATAYDVETLAKVARFASFARINSAPYLSTVGPFDIDVYAQGDVTTYRTIHPATITSSSISVVEGTIIVRAVRDTSGNVSELTAMAKAIAGYDSTLDDWWFAETDLTGNPIVIDGVRQVGRLASCHGCHVPRASEDFLFGVPAADE